MLRKCRDWHDLLNFGDFPHLNFNLPAWHLSPLSSRVLFFFFCLNFRMKHEDSMKTSLRPSILPPASRLVNWLLLMALMRPMQAVQPARDCYSSTSGHLEPKVGPSNFPKSTWVDIWKSFFQTANQKLWTEEQEATQWAMGLGILETANCALVHLARWKSHRVFPIFPDEFSESLQGHFILGRKRFDSFFLPKSIERFCLGLQGGVVFFLQCSTFLRPKWTFLFMKKKVGFHHQMGLPRLWISSVSCLAWRLHMVCATPSWWLRCPRPARHRS